MALRHMDGFNSYAAVANMAEVYSVAGTSNTLQTGRRAGTKALGGNSGEVTQILDAQGSWVAGMAVKAVSGDNCTLIEFQNDSGLEQVSLRMNSLGELYVSRNGTVLWSGAGNPVYTIGNSWQYVEFKTTIDPTNGSFSVRMNGLNSTIVAMTTQNTAGQGGTTASRFRILRDAGSSNVYLADFYVCDGTGSTHNDMLGDCRIDPIRPSADGTYTDFTVTGAASRYLAVDETTHNSDTDYVASDTLGHKVSFALADLPYTPTLVYGVRVSNVQRKDDSGTRGTKILLRTNATDYLSPVEKALTTAYVLDTNTWAVNPDTGTLFTSAEINALEVGAEVTT